MSIERGQIFFVNLNPVEGREQAGKRPNLNPVEGREQAGKRPVLVLSINSINNLPLVVTVIVGTKGSNIERNYATNVRVSSDESGLPIETVFMCFQIRSLDKSRFPAQSAGQISESKMLEVEAGVRYCLGL